MTQIDAIENIEKFCRGLVGKLLSRELVHDISAVIDREARAVEEWFGYDAGAQVKKFARRFLTLNGLTLGEVLATLDEEARMKDALADVRSRLANSGIR